MNDFYEYDPETNAWTKIQDFPGVARYDAVTFAIGDKLYVGTGKDDDKLLYKDFYAYNTSTQAWEDVNSLRGDKRTQEYTYFSNLPSIQPWRYKVNSSGLLYVTGTRLEPDEMRITFLGSMVPPVRT